MPRPSSGGRGAVPFPTISQSLAVSISILLVVDQFVLVILQALSIFGQHGRKGSTLQRRLRRSMWDFRQATGGYTTARNLKIIRSSDYEKVSMKP